ncbi:hypothetical protein R1flu_000097 [Riccia fluitans]|uniref:Uncharacterized protein n=1 Tax=Riccia fluitans TaxID=41844 RepID=A0ABD1Y2L8_9MARC
MQRAAASSFRSCGVRHGIEGIWQLVGGSGCFAAQRYASGVSETSPESAYTKNASNSRILQRVGAVALCGTMGWAAASAAEDVYIYDQCSSKALQKATKDPRLKKAIGDEIKLGQWHWYQASLAVAHEGTSASCSFPVYGTEGVANIRLKAVRLQDQLLYRKCRVRWGKYNDQNVEAGVVFTSRLEVEDQPFLKRKLFPFQTTVRENVYFAEPGRTTFTDVGSTKLVYMGCDYHNLHIWDVGVGEVEGDYADEDGEQARWADDEQAFASVCYGASSFYADSQLNVQVLAIVLLYDSQGQMEEVGALGDMTEEGRCVSSLDTLPGNSIGSTSSGQRQSLQLQYDFDSELPAQPIK